MRIAVLFHHDPLTRAPGIDLVRLGSVALELAKAGHRVEVVAPVKARSPWQDGLKVMPLEVMEEEGRYDLVKTCYHQSILNLGRHRGPVVSRLVRVVDRVHPRRDQRFREELLDCQARIAGRAQAVAFNNRLNAGRWEELYGRSQRIVLTPTGCPASLPVPGPDPYPPGPPPVLFLGSVSSDHMARMLNRAAALLKGSAAIHLVGLNKTGLYGDREQALHPAITVHPPRPEAEVWDFIRHARAGLALAANDQPFDNDVSKIYNYLRGGLPVVLEEPILQAGLVRETGLGGVFGHGRAEEMESLVKGLLAEPPDRDRRTRTMELMARDHSWAARVRVYLDLFPSLV